MQLPPPPTGLPPFEIFFGRPACTLSSNLAHSLDSGRIIQKGRWGSLDAASPRFLTGRNSESDSDEDSLPRLQIHTPERPRCRRQNSSSSSSIVEKVIDDNAAVLANPLLPSPERYADALRAPRLTRPTSMSPAVPPWSSQRASSHTPATRSRVFMKRRPDAKTGTDNFGQITHLIRQEPRPPYFHTH